MEISGNVNYGALKDLVKEMTKEYDIRIGILSSKGNQEVSKDLDMAGLGAVHEFGAKIKVTPKLRAYFRYTFGINLKKTTKYIVIPARSFLRKPIERTSDFLKKVKEKTDYTNKETIKLAEEFIKEHGNSGLLDELATAVALSAFEQIQEAFDTSGFGEWEPNSPLTISNKGSSKQLEDEGRLRKSITYEINKKG